MLLILDGHKSRVSLEAAKYGEAKGIEMVLLPSHTTHLMQPLDVAVFKGFKERYRSEIKGHFERGKGGITRYHLGGLTKRPFEGIAPETIKKGFQVCGFVPLDRCAVLSRLEAEETEKDLNLENEKGKGKGKEERERKGKEPLSAMILARLEALEKDVTFLKLENHELKRKRVEDKEPAGRKRSNISADGLVLTGEEAISLLDNEEKKKIEKGEMKRIKKEESKERKRQEEEKKMLALKEKTLKGWKTLQERGLEAWKSMELAESKKRGLAAKASLTMERLESLPDFGDFSELLWQEGDLFDDLQEEWSVNFAHVSL